MVKEITWSPNAIKDYGKIIFYLFSEWNEGIARRFEEEVGSHIVRIRRFPEVGMKSRQENSVRSVQLSRHNRLFYRTLSENAIEFASIFDTRQDPAKNPYW